MNTPNEARPELGPVAVIGSGYQLLWCRHDWSAGLRVSDSLYGPAVKTEMLRAQEEARVLREALESCTTEEGPTQEELNHARAVLKGTL